MTRGGHGGDWGRAGVASRRWLPGWSPNGEAVRFPRGGRQWGNKRKALKVGV